MTKDQSSDEDIEDYAARKKANLADIEQALAPFVRDYRRYVEKHQKDCPLPPDVCDNAHLYAHLRLFHEMVDQNDEAARLSREIFVDSGMPADRAPIIVAEAQIKSLTEMLAFALGKLARNGL